MYFKATYDPRFDDLLMHLRGKYPEKLFDLEGIGKQTDMQKFSEDFFKVSTTSDISIDANSNVDDISVIAYEHELPKPFLKINSYFLLWKELLKQFDLGTANLVIEKQISGDIYIHDFHGIGAGKPYCFNYSTYDIMLKGLPMVKKIKSGPPKYLYAFKSQLEQFVTIASNSTLGATGLADMFIVMSYYVKNILRDSGDAHFKLASQEDCWEYVKQNLASFIYTINQPMRGNQSPFTNVSVYDDEFLKQIIGDYIFPDGTTPDIEIVKKIQVMFLELMNDELRRTPITFPVTTACMAVDDEGNLLDRESAKLFAHYNKEFGFINLYHGKSSTLSSCCRLRSDTSNEYFNSFGSGSSKIGSLGVVSLNLPRAALTSAGIEEEFFKTVEELVSIAGKVNFIKRQIVKRRIDNGNHPLYTLGFCDLDKQYSTIGINGFYECLKYMDYDILTEEGTAFGLKVIDFINELNDELGRGYNMPTNCEQVPGESMSVKMAEKDKLLEYQNDCNIYSNQFIPLITNADMLDRIYLQGKFDSHFSGGAICHINVESKIEDEEQILNLIEACAKKGVIYWAINYNLQQCVDGHMTIGKGETCSVCGGKIENEYIRVVGFLTNTKNWNKTRREEDYPNRQFYGGQEL